MHLAGEERKRRRRSLPLRAMQTERTWKGTEEFVHPETLADERVLTVLFEAGVLDITAGPPRPKKRRGHRPPPRRRRASK